MKADFDGLFALDLLYSLISLVSLKAAAPTSPKTQNKPDIAAKKFQFDANALNFLSVERYLLFLLAHSMEIALFRIIYAASETIACARD